MLASTLPNALLIHYILVFGFKKSNNTITQFFFDSVYTRVLNLGSKVFNKLVEANVKLLNTKISALLSLNC